MNNVINPIFLQGPLMAQLFRGKVFLIHLPSVTWIFSCYKRLSKLQSCYFLALVPMVLKCEILVRIQIRLKENGEAIVTCTLKNGTEIFFCFLGNGGSGHPTFRKEGPWDLKRNVINCTSGRGDSHRSVERWSLRFLKSKKGMMVMSTFCTATFWISKKFLNNVGRGILSQSRMHVFKIFLVAWP